MSKTIVVSVPNDYNMDNVIERIETGLNDPKITIQRGETLAGKLGDIIRAVDEFQSRLKEIEQL